VAALGGACHNAPHVAGGVHPISAADAGLRPARLTARVRRRRIMKNIQVIDGAKNCVYDVFAATEEEFAKVFPFGQDVAFIDEVCGREDAHTLEEIFRRIWTRRVPKAEAMGIHGTLFYELDFKKPYYPTRRDEEAINPDGTRLRASSPNQPYLDSSLNRSDEK
jgi:hypothetical protein